MAAPSVHWQQATHNEELASYLLANPNPPKFLDWALTAAFYSAVHYVETKFAFLPAVQHTEIAVPFDPVAKKFTRTAHSYREELILKHFTKDAWVSYRKLHSNSETVRYLSNRSGTGFVFKAQAGSEIYTEQDVRRFVVDDLARIKRESTNDVFVRLYEIAKTSGLKIGEETLKKIVGAVTSFTALATNRDAMKTRLAPQEYAELASLMNAAGYWK